MHFLISQCSRTMYNPPDYSQRDPRRRLFREKNCVGECNDRTFLFYEKRQKMEAGHEECSGESTSTFNVNDEDAFIPQTSKVDENKSRASVKSDDSSSAKVLEPLNKFISNRHKTLPTAFGTKDGSDSLDPRSKSVSHTQRKSFFGDIMNFFKKKPESSKKDEDDGLSNKSTEDVSLKSRSRRKAESYLNNESLLSKNEPQDTSKKTADHFSRVTTLQMSIKKWKIQQATEKKPRESIARDENHQAILDEALERLQTEVPRPLEMIINEEAALVVNKTVQMYRSMLGTKHKMTKEAEDHAKYINSLIREPKL